MTFEKKGPQNTEQCIDLVLQAAKERGIKDIVVASSTGATARRLKAYAGEYNIVCVALAYGTREPGSTPMAGETRAELEQRYMDDVADAVNAAKQGYVDDVIEPSATRQMLCAAVEMRSAKRAERPAKKHGNMPL